MYYPDLGIPVRCVIQQLVHGTHFHVKSTVVELARKTWCDGKAYTVIHMIMKIYNYMDMDLNIYKQA